LAPVPSFAGRLWGLRHRDCFRESVLVCAGLFQMADEKGANQVVVAGVSVRAIVQSAARAGFASYAIDRFGDMDTRAAARGWRRLPRRISGSSVSRCLEGLPRTPLVWSSPFENYPRAIEAIGRTRVVWGTAPQAIRMVRSPGWLASTLAAAGLRFPRVWDHPPGDASPGRLVVKRRKSGGGVGIHLAGPHAPRAAKGRRGIYYQEFVPGQTVSGLFWSDGETVHLLAVAEQLVGMPQFGATDFLFCGSVLPAQIDAEIEHQVYRAGAAVARRASLRGLFGVDGVVRGQELYVLEVNPRWTASVELFELASGVNAFALHVRAFAPGLVGGQQGGDVCGRYGFKGVWGRAILYARRPGIFSWRPVLPVGCNHAHGSAWLADIPANGRRLYPGEPVLSVVCCGPTAPAVRGELLGLAKRIYEELLE